jgi:hypothetical protein
MPTLNELLLLGSRPKQLLLCLFAHRKRVLSPTIISWYLPFNITFLNTATIKLFTFFFLGFNVVNSVLIKCPINSLPNKLALYIFLTIHLNIICIAITGNKILCLMSYVLLPYPRPIAFFLPKKLQVIWELCSTSRDFPDSIIVEQYRNTVKYSNLVCLKLLLNLLWGPPGGGGGGAGPPPRGDL